MVAEEPRFPEEGLTRAEVSLCIFPHLEEFLVLDLRHELPGRPFARLFPAAEVFTEEFYQATEKAFSAVLRRKNRPPFSRMMRLPQRIEAIVRQESLSRILASINADVSHAPTPQVSILLGGSQVLTMNDEQLAKVMEYLLGSDSDPALKSTATREIQRLIEQEQAWGQRREQERMKRAILGGDDQFFTLWEQSN